MTSLLLATALVVNPGFDGPKPEKDWVLPAKWKVVEGVGRKGSHAVVWENDDPKFFNYARQNIPLEPGVSYEFGGWAKVESGKPVPHVILGWLDVSNKWISCEFAEALTENDPSADGWTRFEGRTPPLPAHARRGLVHFHQKKGDVGKVKYDSFRVTPVGRVVVQFVVTSVFRNAFTPEDGKVRFFASININTVKTPLDSLKAELVYRDVRGGKTAAAPVSFKSDLVEFAIDAKDFALGEQDTLFRLVMRKDGSVYASKERKVTVTAKPIPRRVRFDRKGRTLIDGKPFYPLGCFSGRLNAESIAELKKGPFNFAMPYGLSSPEEMALCYSNGIYVAPCVMHKVHGLKYMSVDTSKVTREDARAFFKSYVSAIRDQPGMLAYFIVDEVPRRLIPNIAEINDYLQELDSDHPTWAVTDKPTHARDLLPCYDTIGMDPYPVGNHGWRNDIAICSGWALETRRGMFDCRPMWHVPQIFNWGWYRPKELGKEGVRMPTVEEIANMTWQAVAAGANGLCFYSYGIIQKKLKGAEYERAWKGVCDFAREVKRMEPVLLSDGDPIALSGVPTDDLVARAWRHEGRDWVLVVNRGREPVKASVTLPAAYSRLETACGAGATVAGNRLTVDFKGLGYAFVGLDGKK